MRAVLDHNDPLAFLYQKTSSRIEPSTTSPVMMAILKPKSVLHIGHHRIVPEGSPQNALKIGEPGARYQLVRNRPGEEFIEVILPGTGVCWADRADIVKFIELPVRESHPVRHLKLALLEDSNLDNIVQLLKLVGGQLTSLTLALSPSEAIDDAFFDAVSEVCVHVKHLTVMSDSIASWRRLYGQNDVRQSRFRLESLNVQSLESVRDPDEWTALFSALSDPDHPLTKSLREFHLSFNEDTTENLVGIHAQFVEMLDNNHHLTRIELSYADDAILRDFSEQLEKRNRVPVCVEKSPLSAKEKLAFLSATTPVVENVTKKSKTIVGSSSPFARHALTPQLLQSIMDYAAVPKLRKCPMHVDMHLHPFD